MHYDFPLWSYLCLSAAAILAVTAVIVYGRRANQGNRLFALILVAVSIWSFTAAFETGATEVSGKLFWSKWQYIGVVSVPPLWLYFAAEFSGRDKFQKNPFHHLVWVIPGITLALAFTNENHRLIWEEIRILPESVDHVAVYEHGLWWNIHTIYSYFLLLLGNLWLVKRILHFPEKRRTQVVIVLSVIAVAWISNIIYVLGLSPVPGLDITPLSFTVIGIILAWFILITNRLFDLVPVARSKLVENLADGMIVIGPNDVVIDYNAAALEITGYQGPSPLGQPVWKMFEPYLDVIEPLRNQSELYTELKIPCDPPKYLDVKANPVYDETKGPPIGQVIIIRDVTERKQIELVEEDQRRLAEALADTAKALDSTLELEEVLEQILENVGKVVPHDAADISLVDEQGNMRFVKTRGHDKYGTAEEVLSIRANINDIPNMRHMAKTGRPIINPDTFNDPEWIRDIPGAYWIRSYIGAPIISQGKLLGFINVDAQVPNFFREEHLDRLQAFADQAAIAIRNAQMYEEIQSLAITDCLTGLYNRRYFFEFSENELARSKRYGKKLSLAMMDIDHFKRVNDQFGHQTGDRVLKMISDISLKNLRKVDVMCRFGGEEFVILLPETSGVEAYLAAERIRREIDGASLETEKGEVSVTVSIGVADLGEEIQTLDELISKADQAMYQAKDQGRNRVCIKK